MHVPFVVAKADEHNEFAVEADAEQCVEGLPLLGPQVVKAPLDLLDDLDRAWRIRPRADSRGRVGGVFVFDDDARIERVDAALRDGELVPPFELDAHFLFNESELAFDGHADLFFAVGLGRHRADLNGEIIRLSRDLLIARLKMWHRRPQLGLPGGGASQATWQFASGRQMERLYRKGERCSTGRLLPGPRRLYSGAMLLWRLILGAVFISGAAALCWADYRAATPGSWLFWLAMLLALLASGELIAMLAHGGARPPAWVIYLGNGAMVAANWFPQTTGPFDATAAAFTCSLILLFVVEMVRYREPGQSTLRLATALLALAYIGWLLTFVVRLRFVGGNQAGMAALVSLIVVVKMCDIGAYTVGRLIGRHKMAPRLSGGKTIEGLAGGLAFACLGSWCAFTWVVPGLAGAAQSHPPGYAWWVFGLVVGLAGVLGDLAESLLKRDLGCKDSSAWMPGFGGVLDVIDSLLFASPVAYALWIWLVI